MYKAVVFIYGDGNTLCRIFVKYSWSYLYSSMASWYIYYQVIQDTLVFSSPESHFYTGKSLYGFLKVMS
jgi:hypothetical protein